MSWIYFIIIFLTTFLLYYFLPARFSWSVLLLSSLVFLYLVSGIKGLIWILLTIFVSFVCGVFIEKTANLKKRKTILILTILFIVFEFLLLKTNGFYLQISEQFNAKLINAIIIPVGLSYYSLITIAYLVDIYRNIAIMQKNFFKYCLFVVFFPYILLGPIVRYNEVKDQLFARKTIDFDSIKFGFFRILWGIAKKIIIADRIAIVTSTIFGNYQEFSGAYILLAVILFGIQFYVDFSAAMDIVIGAAECLGINLPENFNNPLFSKSFHEYWARWHITLNSFFRDYIFFPAARSNFAVKARKYFEKLSSKRMAAYAPVLFGYVMVWIIAGLWHGVQIKFLIANCILPCIFIILEDIFKPYIAKFINKFEKLKDSYWLKLFSMVYVFSFLCISWFFFNATTSSDAINMLKKILFVFYVNKTRHDIGVDIYDLTIISLGVALILIIDVLKEFKINLRQMYIKTNTTLTWLIISVMLIIILLFGMYGFDYGVKDFIYFKL